MEKIWIYTATIKEDQEHLDKLLLHLPLKDQFETKKIKFLSDKLCKVYGRLLLQKAAFVHFQCEDLLERIEIDKYGKPFVEGINFSFNISHSGNTVVCAVSGSPLLGIDIEKPRETKQNVFERVFSSREIEMLSISNNQNLLFRQYWTRKESVVKAIGKGIQMGLNTFDVIDGRLDIEGKQLHIFDLDLPNQFVGAICSDYYISKIELKTVEL